ncbi:hypothetical protein JCM15579A_02780 [Marinifilum fragile]
MYFFLQKLAQYILDAFLYTGGVNLLLPTSVIAAFVGDMKKIPVFRHEFLFVPKGRNNSIERVGRVISIPKPSKNITQIYRFV